MEIEQQLIEYVAKTLVDKPDAVRVERVVDDRGVLLTLHVDDEDLGRVIGKGGATAQSLRLILKALGSKNDERYNLRIADGQPRPEPGERSRTNDKSTTSDDSDDDQSVDKPDDDNDEPVDKPDDDSDQPVDEPEVGNQLAADPETDEPAVAEQSEVEKAKSELASLDDLDI